MAGEEPDVHKIFALLTITAFLAFDMNCVVRSIRKIPGDNLSQVHDLKAEIFSLSTKSGETIEFPTTDPGRIEGDKIVGSIPDGSSSEWTVTQDMVRQVKKDATGEIVKITIKDRDADREYEIGRGQKYTSIKPCPDGFILVSPNYRAVSIPLSDIKTASIRRKDDAGTFFASLAMISLAFLSFAYFYLTQAWPHRINN
jgi:hypothetical protein